MNTEERWNQERRIYRVGDTEDARRAFYVGARHTMHLVLSAMEGNGDMDASLLQLNEELLAFAQRGPKDKAA